MDHQLLLRGVIAMSVVHVVERPAFSLVSHPPRIGLSSKEKGVIERERPSLVWWWI